ncbi:glycosyltransferase [Rhodocytophaga rosea]|uniref:Glycosyltransferase n=1 Tax=Rhodocytophaga rosea TaxID=2704465 RepID=A0A6C0GPT2_9BACT|nr:glycosyltransferase [Rhodocytophaga rosea]QHT69592.1 glycosyltransferase [Rhodocytophaga rosea]
MKNAAKMIRLAIIAPEKNPYSTTFIQAHKELLEAKISYLYGVFFPAHTQDDVPLISTSIVTTAKKIVYSRILGKEPGYLRKRALYNYLKTHHIEAVLAEFGPTGAEVFPVCQLAGIPLIVHFHGFDAWVDSILEKYKSRYRQMFEYASYIIVVSRDMEQQLLKLGAPRAKVIYNCYGPRDIFFYLNSNFEKINYLAVGRFVEKKAPYLTVMAFAEVLKQIPEARLTMIGDGELLPICKNITTGLGISHAIEFTGALSHEETCKLFEKSFCFIQHSIVAENGDSEGTPVAILEASAAGLPVVATCHAGIKEAIVHGKTGFLVEEKDIKGMAHCMIRLAKDRPLAKQTGEQGRRFVSESFSMQQHISKLNELLKQLVIKK